MLKQQITKEELFCCLAASASVSEEAAVKDCLLQEGYDAAQTFVVKGAQLGDARREAQNALAEWLRYPTPYYEAAWDEALDKVQRLEARIPKRKATSGG